MKIAFYYVDDKYIEYLKSYEKEKRGFTCVPNVTYSNRDKFTYGSVLEINNINYYVPVSSKTNKNLDNNILIKTDDKKNPVKGSLRFQYMIPVPTQCLHICKMEDFPNDNYRTKVSKELAFCRRNRDKIFKQAEKTYDRVIKGASEKLNKNSCDFKMLEAACLEYMDIELNGREGKEEKEEKEAGNPPNTKSKPFFTGESLKKSGEANKEMNMSMANQSALNAGIIKHEGIGD